MGVVFARFVIRQKAIPMLPCRMQTGMKEAKPTVFDASRTPASLLRMAIAAALVC